MPYDAEDITLFGQAPGSAGQMKHRRVGYLSLRPPANAKPPLSTPPVLAKPATVIKSLTLSGSKRTAGKPRTTPPTRSSRPGHCPDNQLEGVSPKSFSGRARSPSAPPPLAKWSIPAIFGLPFGALGESTLPNLGFWRLGHHALEAVAVTITSAAQPAPTQGYFPAPQAVYKGCTRDAHRMYKGSAHVHPVCIPCTPLVHAVRAARARLGKLALPGVSDWRRFSPGPSAVSG